MTRPATERLPDRFCARCDHPESCHGENGCEVEVRDYGDPDCFCRAFLAPRRPVARPA